MRQLQLFFPFELGEPTARGCGTDDDGLPEDDDDDGDEEENRAFCSAYTAIVRDRLGDDGLVSLSRRLVWSSL